jgi:hypothetical protein
VSAFPSNHPCQCSVEFCVCGPDEKALRAIIASDGAIKMTPQQRLWCLAEIDSVEGYTAHDYHGKADEHLARGVLSAWTDYARDKGLI